MKRLPASVRKIIIESSKRAHVGHIGCALSIVEILVALYEKVLTPKDRFVLSKGHAALALYALLFLKGKLSKQQLDTFCQDGSFLGVHPEHFVEGIHFSTGSLGQGLSFGCGTAYAGNRSFVVMSDAECNEGSVWESALFAAHHGLSNLTAVVDVNGQQALGYTNEVLDMASLSNKWKSFGWHVQNVNGHRVSDLVKAFETPSQRPKVILAKTTCGKGVSYMEKRIKWHYWPMNDQEYDTALKEVSSK